MSSINTNLSAMTALQQLKTTQTSLNKTQGQISTGLRVGSASDNASYWSIATQMKSDNGALGAVKDSLKQSVSMSTAFLDANDKVLGYLNKLKEGLVAAQQPGADKVKINGELQTLIQGIKSVGESASINGENWLTKDTDTAMVASYNGDSGQVGFITNTSTTTKLFTVDATTGLYTADSGGKLGAMIEAIAVGISETSANSDIQTLLDNVNAGIKDVSAASAHIGANKTLLESQLSFTTSLSDALTSNVSSLVDADMNEASTRLQALQTQQQLGVQALSIANQNSQMILKLFQ